MRSFFDDGELEAAFDFIDAIENDAEAIADGVAVPAMITDDLACVFAVSVDIVDQAIERHQAFDEQIGELDEEPELGGVHDHRIEVFADAVLHELYLLPLDELPLGFGGASLVVGRFFGDGARGPPREGLAVPAIAPVSRNARFAPLSLTLGSVAELANCRSFASLRMT